MGPLSIRAARPDDAETLFTIHRESTTTAHVKIFPPDRYRFPDARMRKVWAEALRSDDISAVIAERAGSPVGFATVSPGWLRNPSCCLPSGAAEPALRSTTRPLLRKRAAGGTTAAGRGRSSRLIRSSSGTRSGLVSGAHRRVGPIPNPNPPKGMSFEASARIRAGL
jgi:hypothetical protein